MQFFTACITASLFFATSLGAAIPKLAERADEVADVVYQGLDATQSRNAQAAMDQVRAQGLPRQACLAVISTALQESTLHIYANPAVPASMNYPHDSTGGDQDSVGMFQQRPEWYPDIAKDMIAAGSTEQFLAAMLLVPGWETMDVSTLDQTVQKAQAGNLYAKRVPLAQQVCSAGGF